MKDGMVLSTVVLKAERKPGCHIDFFKLVYLFLVVLPLPPAYWHPLVAVSRSHSFLWCMASSLWWLLLLQRAQALGTQTSVAKHMGLVAP